MNFLEYEYAATRGKKPQDEARRALLATSIAVLDLADKITRRFKDTEAIDDVVGKCIAGGKPQPLKELLELSEATSTLKGIFADAKRAEDKRKEREAKQLEKAAAVAAEGAKKPKKERVKKTPIPKVIKDEIWDYYIGNTVAQVPCPCCQKTPITMRDFVAGHVLSEKHGGAITCANLVPICNKCNSSMGARHMVEFCMKHWGRPPLTPRNIVVFDRALEAAPVTLSSPRAEAPKKFVLYKHCRLIAGGHADAARFASDPEAVAYATSKKYTAITHKSGSGAMYYFADKPCKKAKVSTSEEEPGYEFDSWRLE
jgi:hypothetical protein